MEDEVFGSMCVCVSEVIKIYLFCRVGRFFMVLGVIVFYLVVVFCFGFGINYFLI